MTTQSDKPYLKSGLNRSSLKWIAIIAMTVDHYAWLFVPTHSVLGQIFHAIGRLTGPIMFFFIAQGYIHTHNVKKYLLRLFLFAGISTLPFSFFETGQLRFTSFGVIYTLALGLAAIWAYDKIPNRFLSWTVIILLGFLSLYGDWAIIGVIFCLIFYINRENYRRLLLSSVILTVGLYLLYVIGYANSGASLAESLYTNAFTLAIIAPVLLLRLYNGENGAFPGSRWLFYIYYPLHLVILGLLHFGVPW